MDAVVDQRAGDLQGRKRAGAGRSSLPSRTIGDNQNAWSLDINIAPLEQIIQGKSILAEIAKFLQRNDLCELLYVNLTKDMVKPAL